MVDDTLYEEGEELRLVLGSPKSDSQFGASVGALNETLVKIKDTADSKPDEGGGEGCAANPRIKICDEIKKRVNPVLLSWSDIKGSLPRNPTICQHYAFLSVLRAHHPFSGNQVQR